MKNMDTIKKALLLTGLLALTAAPAYAAEANTGGAAGLYGTASVGQTRADIEDIPGFSIDDTDTGYSIGVGYEFNKYVALEAGYADLGEVTLTSSTRIASTEGDGFYLGPQFSLPVTNKFSILGKIGLFTWDADTSSNYGYSASDDGTDIYFGGGLAYHVTDMFTVKAEWTRYDNVGDDNTTGSANVDFISGGLVFNFGRLL